MRSDLFRSLLIAIVLGIVLTAISTVLTATYLQESEANGTATVLTGWAASIAAIDACGFGAFLKGTFGTLLLFFTASFIAALWQALWSRHKE